MPRGWLGGAWSRKVRPLSVEPRTVKGSESKLRLLGAARRVFARRGYVSTRMIDVAEEAGVSLGALYRYFANREDLFAAMVGELHKEMYEASGAHGADIVADPLGTLVAANKGYYELYYANRDVLRAFIEAATVERRFRDIWWEMRRRHVDRFLAVLRANGCERAGTRWGALAAEAAAAASEHAAYVWFAQASMTEPRASVEEATQFAASIWYNLFWGDSAKLGFDNVLPAIGDDTGQASRAEPDSSSSSGRKRAPDQFA